MIVETITDVVRAFSFIIAGAHVIAAAVAAILQGVIKAAVFALENNQTSGGSRQEWKH